MSIARFSWFANQCPLTIPPNDFHGAVLLEISRAWWTTRAWPPHLHIRELWSKISNFSGVSDCSKSQLSHLFLCMKSSVSFPWQSGGKFSEYLWQSHHTLSGQTVGFVIVTVFPSMRITSMSAPYTGTKTRKNLSEDLGIIHFSLYC